MFMSIFPPYTWQTRIIATAALCAVFFLAGWTTHGWKTDAVQARSIPKAIKTAQAVQKEQAPIVEKKQAELVRTEIVYKTIKEKIYENNDQRICFADTTAWQLYNSAIIGSDLHRSESPGATTGNETAKGQEGDGDENSQIVATVTDVLSNATDNYETCRKNSVKHNALIDAVNGFKDKMCVCQE